LGGCNITSIKLHDVYVVIVKINDDLQLRKSEIEAGLLFTKFLLWIDLAGLPEYTLGT
jgi:hypothetical protein